MEIDVSMVVLGGALGRGRTGWEWMVGGGGKN